MRIHRVTLEGFGPYRGREVVDLDAFEPDGIFLITGRTGAGKTSLLDAITYALFGRVPRYDGLAGDRVRSDHIDPTDVCEVQLEFSVPAGRHRITRRPAHVRPKKRGTGTTPVKASFELAVRRPDGWEVLESKEGNAERHVGDVVPLTAEQFQQVILLAQGEFQQFLVADSTTRRDLLSRLFDTSRFTAYSDDLTARARELGQQVEQSATALTTNVSGLAAQLGTEPPAGVDVRTGAGLPQWLDAVEHDGRTTLQQHHDALHASATAHRSARERLDAGRDLLRRQERLAAATRRRQELAARVDEIEQVRDRVARARRAAVAWQALRAVEEAVREVASARGLVDRAEQELARTGSAPGPEEAEARVVALTTLLGSLAGGRRDESALPRLEGAHADARRTVERFEAGLASTRSECVRIEEELVELRSRREALAGVLDETEGAELALEQGRTGLQAAEDQARHQRAYGDALARQKEAAARHAEAARTHSELLQRQYAEYAGVLAADLTDGDDCPVCGATEHPAKASLTPAHVSAEQLERAADSVEWARKELDEAGTRAAEAATLLASATEHSGGRDVGAWRDECAAATGRVQLRSTARRDLQTVEERRTSLGQRLHALTASLEAEQTERTRLAGEVATAAQALETARRRVAECRGGHATVADHVAAVEVELALLRRVVITRAALGQAGAGETTARAALSIALTEQEFVGVDEVRAARLDEGDLTARAHQVAEHDAQVHAVEEALAAPELQDVPPDPVDVPALVAAEQQADDDHAAAARTCGAVEEQHRAVTTLVGRIRADLASSQQGREEYAVLSSLAETLRGQGQNERRMTLESFALAAELEEIVAAANGRLARMTDGRYEFRHSDAVASHGARSGLALDVLDAHTGEARSPRSLSGGEKFQASLALALGLAEVVTERAGGLRLDTLFVDEGFGSLDPETLESTMATLDSLREGGRTVGLISHVATLKETVPAQLHVEVTPGGWSTLG